MIYLILDDDGDYALYRDNDPSTLSIYNFRSITGDKYYVKSLPSSIKSTDFEHGTGYTYESLTTDTTHFQSIIATLFDTNDYCQFISTHPELLI